MSTEIETMPNESSTAPTVRLSRRSEWSSRGAISFLMQQGAENPGVLSLAAGFVDPSTLPVEETRRAFLELFADDTRARQALQYGTSQGSESLRERLVPFFSALEGKAPAELGLTPADFFLTTGSQQLLSIVCEILFDPGDICLVASPTYFVFLGALEGVGARAITVPTDEHGMSPEALDEILSQLADAGELPRVKLVYAVSYYENPSGISLSTDRRPRLLDIVRKWSRAQRIFVLEDAAYRELHYDGEAYPSLWSFDAPRDTVIYTQTFSKSFSPGLRVGFGLIPEPLRQAVIDRKGNEDFGSAHLTQRIVSTALADGAYPPHLEQVKQSYRAKRDAMLAAAQDYFTEIPGARWEVPHGGLYVWMTLSAAVPTGFDSQLFSEAVKHQGVMYVPGELCFAPDRLERNHMRLSFGVLPPDQIREGMRRLAAAVKAVMG